VAAPFFMRAGTRSIFLAVVLTLFCLKAFYGCGGSVTTPSQSAAPTCDPTLWNHVHDPTRLTISDACRTVTGTVVTHHSNDDGDIDMQVALDPQFESLLVTGNRQSLNGRLQVEAVCQAPVIKYSEAACAGFAGTVPIPADGTRVQITGSYVLDTNHGWMEIHPVSVITVLR
jgi:hypothetical protein